jgi:hypothetical protein
MKPEKFDLAKVLWPIEADTFFRDSWEKQPLAVVRDDPAYYQGLFSRRDLDDLIAFTRPKFFDNLQPGAPPRLNVVHGWLPHEEPFAGYYPNLADVRRAVAHGKTLLITGMQQRWPAVAAMGRALETFFGCMVHTNLYFTPPGAQGFDPHYDTHEVFVLQIDGDKHWRLYGPGKELPLPNDKSAISKEQLGPPTQEVLLRSGDLLYLPRGHIHEAHTSESASLHLTVGVNVLRWLDLLQLALSRAAAADVRFRRSLPVGLLCADASPPSLRDKFHEAIQHFAKNADLEGAVGAMAEAFVGGMAALPGDYFAAEDLDGIDLDAVLEKARGVLCRVIQRSDKVTLLAPGARIDGPANLGPAMRYIAQAQRFTPAELPDNLTPEAKLALVRRLLRERVLTIVGLPDDDADTPETTARDGR